MDGRSFLIVARNLASRSTEAFRRAAVGRCYYALLLECRDTLERWGFPPPSFHSVHSFVRLRFINPQDLDLRHIGDILIGLHDLRNKADYNIARPGPFSLDREALQSLTRAADAIARLDAIDHDAARRASAVAAIQAEFP